jgi:ubiquitin-conjugating enzyme E2 W
MPKVLPSTYLQWQKQATTDHHNKANDKIYEYDNNNIMSVLMELRGGGKSDEISIEDTSSSNPIMTKVRNLIRSVLKVGDRKAPSVSRALRSILKGLESSLGIKLLPKTSKKKGKKKKGTANKETTKDRGSGNDKKSPIQETHKTKPKKPTAATEKHLTQKISSFNPNYRIQRELKEFIKEPPPNLNVKVGKNIRVWIVNMIGAKGSIYEGEVYKLRISFPTQYPTVPPSVYFLPPNIPKHEHVYTNGDVCLSLLGKDWRPTMTAQSIANSILSILSSAQSKSIPMDNAKHAQNKPGQYQESWIYHDDNC